MSIDWKKEISVLVYIKQVLSDLDKNHLWEHHFPEVAAGGKEIENVEQHLGFQLDDRYAEFLRHANGWRSFYQSVDLFGTKDLLGSDAMQNAKMMLDVIDENAMKASRLNKDDLLPIGASSLDLDIFFIVKPSSEHSGQVIWFAGQEIDRFKNFYEFYLAMVDYNRAEVEDLRSCK
jgi:hypothetical protein